MPLNPSNPSAAVGVVDPDEDEEDDEENMEREDDVHPASTKPAAITATSRADGGRLRDKLIAILIEFLRTFRAYRCPALAAVPPALGKKTNSHRVVQGPAPRLLIILSPGPVQLQGRNGPS
jgi:hypothetical protein